MTHSASFDLADLLTAAGASMATANGRLAAGGAPALMRQFDLGLEFPGAVRLLPCAAGVCIIRPRHRCVTACGAGGRSTVRIQATYIAAPSLVPVPPS